jgi:hypothetical protein
VKWLAGLANTFLASAKRAEVLGGLWNNIGEEFHDDPTSRLAADGHIKENPGVCHYEREKLGISLLSEMKSRVICLGFLVIWGCFYGERRWI